MLDKDKEKNREYNKRYNQRPEVKLRKREWYEKNKERILKERKEYREKNKDRIKEYIQRNKEKIAKRDKEYREKNKDKIKENWKEYYKNNKYRIKKYRQEPKIKLKIKEYAKNYSQRQEVKLKRNKYEKEYEYKLKRNKRRKLQRTVDFNFRIRERIRSNFYLSLKKYSTTGKIKSLKEYGIDMKMIIKHLKPFPKDIKDYHVDHIRPLVSFNFINKDGSTNLKEIKKAWTPENLQWLTAEENVIKGSKIL